jgi:hypothetical protein
MEGRGMQVCFALQYDCTGTAEAGCEQWYSGVECWSTTVVTILRPEAVKKALWYNVMTRRRPCWGLLRQIGVQDVLREAAVENARAKQLVLILRERSGNPSYALPVYFTVSMHHPHHFIAHPLVFPMCILPNPTACKHQRHSMKLRR